MRTPRVNLKARVLMSRLMRAFASGQITNFEFDDLANSLAPLDDAVSDACLFAWGYYCDVRTHRIAGDWRFGREQRRAWARWVLLLRTDLPAKRGLTFSKSAHVGCVAILALLFALSIVLGVWPLAAVLAVPLVICMLSSALALRERYENGVAQTSCHPFVSPKDESTARAGRVFLCGGGSPL